MLIHSSSAQDLININQLREIRKNSDNIDLLKKLYVPAFCQVLSIRKLWEFIRVIIQMKHCMGCNLAGIIIWVKKLITVLYGGYRKKLPKLLNTGYRISIEKVSIVSQYNTLLQLK